MTKGDCKCEGAERQRWGQADETIDGRMALGWLNGWMDGCGCVLCVVVVVGWIGWLVGGWVGCVMD